MEEVAVNPRPISRGDEPQVYSLIDRCYREHGFSLNLADECEQHLADPGAYFRSHGGEFWVVCDEDGAARATVAIDFQMDRSIAELKSMYVDAAWRRRGIGSALTMFAMKQASDRGAVIMELWSDTRFDAAHRMYESLGFVRIGLRDIVDSNQSSEWGYRRALDGSVVR